MLVPMHPCAALLSTASWSDPETFVTLMSIFLGAFPTPTPLQESSWSRLSGLPPPLPGLEPLSFGEKFLLHRVRTLRVGWLLPRRRLTSPLNGVSSSVAAALPSSSACYSLPVYLALAPAA